MPGLRLSPHPSRRHPWPTTPALAVAAGDAPRSGNLCADARGRPARPTSPAPGGQLGASRLHGFPHFPAPLARSARMFSRKPLTLPPPSPRLRWALESVFARLLRAPERLAAPHLPACAGRASTRVLRPSFRKFFAPNLLHLLHETAIPNDMVRCSISLFLNNICCKTLFKKGLFWDSKSGGRDTVWVRPPLPAPIKSST